MFIDGVKLTQIRVWKNLGGYNRDFRKQNNEVRKGA
jgi:hypothetical protein